MSDQERIIPNYMPLHATEQQVQDAVKLTEDEDTVTDSSGLNNKEKWEKAKHVFNAPQASLFARLDYTEVYNDDVSRTAEAAYYIADLRKQYLSKLLDNNPGEDYEYLHICYRENLVWLVRLRERARLTDFCEAAKRIVKAN